MSPRKNDELRDISDALGFVLAVRHGEAKVERYADGEWNVATTRAPQLWKLSISPPCTVSRAKPNHVVAWFFLWALDDERHDGHRTFRKTKGWEGRVVAWVARTYGRWLRNLNAAATGGVK